MAVVTISRDFGAEGEKVAARTAEKLGYAHIGKELVAEIAKQLNLSKGEAEMFNKASQSRLMRMVDRYTCTIVQKVVDREHGCLDDREYFEATKRLVETLYDAGDVVILGWGGQCILKGRPDVCHVRLTREMETKIRYVMAHERLDRQAAEALIAREEKDLKSYIRHYFDEDWNDARLYNLVIDMSHQSPDQAAAAIADHVRQMVG